MSEKKIQSKNKSSTKVEIFTVPIESIEIHSEISTKLNKSKQLTKEEIIGNAIRFHSLGNIKLAAKNYQLFIDKGFLDERVFSNYGSIIRNNGNLKLAEILTRKAIKINPYHAISHYNLGNILCDANRLEEAELSMKEAIRINKYYIDAYLNLGDIQKDLDKFIEAEISTKKAIELNPNHAGAYNNLGVIYKDSGKLKESELATRKAIKIDPNLAIAHSNLGSILCTKG